MAPTLKPRSFAPYDSALGSETQDFLNWVQVSLNQLITQGQAPQGSGLQTLSPNTVNPTTSQLVSAGSRPYSIATPITAVAQPTTISFYWDGTNGSQVFQIGRDDGTNFGPSIVGSPLTITGLTANTKYFFYFFFNEAMNIIQAVNLPTVSVGTPAIAFTSKTFKAAQAQILRGQIPLAGVFVSSGITTPSSGTITVQGGNGGGAGAIGAGFL